MALCFSTGVELVHLSNGFDRRSVEIVLNLQKDVRVTRSSQNTEYKFDGDPEFSALVDDLALGEFYLLGHGCGNGFVTGYITSGRKLLSHSSKPFKTSGEAASAYEKKLEEAESIIDESREITRYEERVRRTFFRGKSEGEDFFEIVTLGKGGRDIESIVGPDKETTQLLEKYLFRDQ